MSDSSIEWTDKTWNPVAGCSIMTAGCTNCYAMRMAARLEAMGVDKYKGLTRKSGGRSVWTGKVNCDDNSLSAPLKWKSPKKIFVNSMSDLFHENVPSGFILKVWQVMEATPQHTYQILTKRPDRMRTILAANGAQKLPNVWLGTSIEDNRVVDRLEELKSVPAVIRFVSFEPLIGPVGDLNLDKIHWAIVGGESGPKSRPINQEWVGEIHTSCKRAETAFFFKQWGGKNKKAAGRVYQGRTWDHMPDLRI